MTSPKAAKFLEKSKDNHIFKDSSDYSANAEAETEVTRNAARFTATLQHGEIPSEAVEIGIRCILDTVGLYVAGLSEASVQIVAGLAGDDGGKPQALLLGAGEKRVPVQASARVLGISAHAHDFDDTQVSHDPLHVYGLLTHPSTAPLSAALAVSDLLGDVSGDQFMTAFLGGFEVSCKVSEWLSPDHYLRGHHSSGTVATFGAAMAAGKLWGLSEMQLRHALGIAASMAAGVRCGFGTMCKPWHVGRAAENGVLAAKMAQHGFTGDLNALDGRWGFASVLGGGFTVEKLGQGFGKTWSIVDPGVSIKPYPSGILTHQAMDMVLNLIKTDDIRPDDVESIVFSAGDNILNPIRYPIAENALQAKFSMAALLSMLVIDRAAGLAQFNDEFIASARFQDMQRRIACRVDEDINAQGFDLIRSKVEIKLVSGETKKAAGDIRYRGGPSMPFTEDDVLQKVRDCCHAVPEAVTENLIAASKALPESGPSGLLDALRLIPSAASQ